MALVLPSETKMPSGLVVPGYVKPRKMVAMARVEAKTGEIFIQRSPDLPEQPLGELIGEHDRLFRFYQKYKHLEDKDALRSGEAKGAEAVEGSEEGHGQGGGLVEHEAESGSIREGAVRE